DYRPWPCVRCKEQIPAIHIATHSSTNCKKRPVECSTCKQTIPSDQLQRHEVASCPDRVVSCTNAQLGCAVRMRLADMLLHHTPEFHCDYTTHPCPFDLLGDGQMCPRVSKRDQDEHAAKMHHRH